MLDTDIRATVRYLVPSGAKPVYVASRGGADAALDIGAEFEDHTVTIYDARQLRPAARERKRGAERPLIQQTRPAADRAAARSNLCPNS